MDSPSIESRVNDLLVEIYRSLLHYVSEAAYPWSDSHGTDLKQTVEQAAARQEEDVHAIVDFLSARIPRVDFGVYPPEYTSLHFVAFSYLMDQLIASQKAVVEEIEAELPNLESDAEAHALIQQVLDHQREYLKSLESAGAATA